MKRYDKNGNYTKTYIKFMKQHLEEYYSSNTTDIFDAYEKPSNYKMWVWEDIQKKSNFTARITSYNTFKFTACYFEIDACEKYFIVRTGYDHYLIRADEL